MSFYCSQLKNLLGVAEEIPHTDLLSGQRRHCAQTVGQAETSRPQLSGEDVTPVILQDTDPLGDSSSLRISIDCFSYKVVQKKI